mgnify:CR=1 FL=1
MVVGPQDLWRRLANVAVGLIHLWRRLKLSLRFEYVLLSATNLIIAPGRAEAVCFVSTLNL